MDMSMLAAGGLGVGIASFFTQIKMFLSNIRKFIIGMAEYDVLNECFMVWIQSKKGIDFGDPRYAIKDEYVNGRTIVGHDLHYKDKIFIRFLPMPVFVRYSGSNMVMTYIKGLTKPDKILQELFDIYDRISTRWSDELENSHCNHEGSEVYFRTGSLGSMAGRENFLKAEEMRTGMPTESAESPSEKSASMSMSSSIPYHLLVKFSKRKHVKRITQSISKPLDGLYYNDVVMNIIEEVGRWIQLKQWYTDRKIAWKRGLMLTGQPGTGKSSLVRAIGQEYGMDIYSFNLSTFTDGEFATSVWSVLGGIYPRILLFEEIDVYFKKRQAQNKNTMSTPLTFSTFLNVLDGVKQMNGAYIIVTTNKEEDLDEALMRPGRIDTKIELKPFGKEGKQKVADFILGEWPEEAQKIIDSSPDLITGAEFKELCIKKAISLKWDKQKESTCD